MAVDAGTIYSEVRIALDKLKGDITQVEAQFNKFSKTNATTATKTQKKWTDSFKNINLQGVIAVAALTLAVKKSISIYSAFEQSLANVQSVARATPKEFEAIEKAAIEAGESTRFTATQAAEAMYFLASAGLKGKDIMDALNGTLQLAGATQSDLASTAATLTATLSQFNLESTKSIDISNIFAAAIANSQATMEKLSTSLSYVGPVAAAFGLSVEQTVGSLQILYNAGLKASTAGTALRSILSDLGNESGPLIKKLEKWGLTFEDVSLETHSFAEVIEIMTAAGVEGIDAMALFGDRAGPAMISLLSAGREEIEAYTEAVTGTEAAAEAYAIQNDTLAGSLDFLKSASESAQISLVKEMAPAIRGLVDLLTGLIKGFTSLPGPVKLFFGIVAVGIPVVAGLAFVISSLAAAIGASLGPITLIVAGIAGLIAVVATISGATDTYTTSVENLNKATEDLNTSNDELNEINKTLADTTKTLNDAEKKTLENRKELLKQNMAYQIAAQAKAISDAQKESEKLNAELEKQTKFYDEIIKSGEVSADVWGDVFAGKGFFVFGEAKNVLEDLSKVIDETTGKQANLNSTIEDGTDALVEGVIAGNISIAQIKQINSNLGARVDILVFLRKGEKELADLKAKSDSDEEAARLAREASDAEDKRLLDDARKAWLENNEKRIELEKEYSDKVFEETNSRLAILEKEKNEALQIAKDLGANKADIEEFYSIKRQEILDEEADAAAEAAEKEKIITEEKIKAIGILSEEAARKKQELLDEEEEAHKDNLQKMLDATEDFAFSVGGVLNNLIATLAESRIAELDRQLEAQLQAAGVAEETTIERLNRELEAAKEAGDAELIAEKEQAIKRAEITLEFERKKAKIRYDSEMAMWKISLLQAGAEMARAINVALGSAPFPFNVPAIAFATGIGLLNVGIVKASEPVKPSFKTGGIVLGSPTAPPDSVDAKLTPGEIVMAGEQQKRLWDVLTGKAQANSGSQYITIQFYQDSRRTAEKTVQYINGGIVRLKL